MTRLYAPFMAVAVTLLTFGSSSASNPAPSAPTKLVQSVNGVTLNAGTWTKGRAVVITMQATGNGSTIHPEINMVPVGHTFTGVATFKGQGVPVGNGSTTTLSLRISGIKDGSYAWEARVVDSQKQASGWVPFTPYSTPALRIDTTPPTAPRISSQTNPQWNGWYRTKVESFTWSSHDAGSGVVGYSFALNHRAHSARPGLIQSTPSATIRNTRDGRWILHVWARDEVGNWSRAGIYKFNILRRAPQVRFDGLAVKHFNPYTGKEQWTFSLSRLADVHVDVTRSGLKGAVLKRSLGELRRGRHGFVWSGRRAKGHVVPRGWYWIRVFARDNLGNHKAFAFGGVNLRPYVPRLPFYARTGKHIVISLSKQVLYAYKGSKLVWQSLTTTGNPALPTPTGHFSIFAKFHPFEFISPWPPGSPYWYPPSWTSYSMEFISGGYFIHDAPWRSVFGPGSDGPGQPGTNYGGTHGCVNVPLNTSHFLFYWAPMGTPVDVLN